MSVTDQYLFRGGFSHAIPGVRHLSASFGGRMEGIPVRAAFGSSNGFRRPGYIISIDPGIMYGFCRTTVSLNARGPSNATAAEAFLTFKTEGTATPPSPITL
jgi:hypothetical protein